MSQIECQKKNKIKYNQHTLSNTLIYGNYSSIWSYGHFCVITWVSLSLRYKNSQWLCPHLLVKKHSIIKPTSRRPELHFEGSENLQIKCITLLLFWLQGAVWKKECVHPFFFHFDCGQSVVVSHPDAKQTASHGFLWQIKGLWKSKCLASV